MKKCSVAWCRNESNARGVCRMHYYRLRVHGDPLLVLQTADGGKANRHATAVLMRETGPGVFVPAFGVAPQVVPAVAPAASLAPIAPRPAEPTGALKYHCRTCGKFFESYSDTVFEHDGCACPCVTSWR